MFLDTEVQPNGDICICNYRFTYLHLKSQSPIQNEGIEYTQRKDYSLLYLIKSKDVYFRGLFLLTPWRRTKCPTSN